MKKRFRLTFLQACAISFLVHSAIAIPFVAPRFVVPPEEPPTLVIDLEGLVSDDQEETKVLEQIKGVVAQQTQQTAPPPPNQPPPPPPEPEPELSKEPPPDAAMAAPPPAEPTPAPGKDKADIAGTQQQQQAQSIEARPLDRDKLNEYVKGLSKKIRSNFSYESSGRRASAVVAFTILKDGNIRPETLKIVESTGQPKLDANAMQTIRASAPFDPPPEPLTIAVIVDFERKR